MAETQDPRRALPSVDALLARPEFERFRRTISQEFLTLHARNVLAEARARIESGKSAWPETQIAKKLLDRLSELGSLSMRPVINATGVVLHTGLGRARLADEAVEAAVRCAGYCNLEFDLESGDRGDRQEHSEELLCTLTGAESALVVNNNAAAVFLALNTLAYKREVIVSRGQLIEIGGSFRLPDIMRRAEVKLVEVGTTNRTRIADYHAALTPKTALLLRAYPSNYRVAGFTESVDIGELAALSREADIPLVDDLGGGLFFDWVDQGLPYEPNVKESLEQGADLVLVSGDKVIGGPQAGIIVGKRSIVDRLKKSPLARVLRIDKLTLAALRATLICHLDRAHLAHRIPTWSMLMAGHEEMRSRAERLKTALQSLTAWNVLDVRETASEAGSGTLPAVALPSIGICSLPQGMTAGKWAKQLRLASVPVVGTVRQDLLWFDMRTVSGADENLLIASVAEVLKQGG